MAHRQSFREGPAHSTAATPSTPTPIMDCDEDYAYQDNRDTQQIADDSIAFLRTFSLRLQRFRAQVGKFAYVDQSDDMEMSDNGPIKVTTTTTDDTRPDESSSSPADERGDSLNKQSARTPKLCGQCESSRSGLPDITPQSPTTQIDRTPPCPDDTYPDHPFPEGTCVTIGAYSPPSSLQGTYVAKYLNIRRTYATIGSERGSPRPNDPPFIVEDDSDELNNGTNPTDNQQPAPHEQETTRTAYKETSQPTGDTQKTAHIERETPPLIHQTTRPSGRPRLGFAIPSKEQTKHTTDLWAYSTDTTQNHKAKPPRHKRTSVPALTTRETNKTTYGFIETEDTTEREITGLVPDRGKESRYETQRVNLI